MTFIEENRPKPGFTIEVVNGIRLPKGEAIALAYALQDVYDIAANSMDFGSGFLSTEEVEHLRILGRLIGAPPLHYQCESSRPKGLSKGGGYKQCSCGVES